MNIYVIKTAEKIYPFGDRPADLFIGNKCLRDIHIEEIKKTKCNPVFIDTYDLVQDAYPHLVFYDNVFVTSEAIQLIKKTGVTENTSFVCAFSNSYYIDSFLWSAKRDKDGEAILPVYYMLKKGRYPEKKKVLLFDCKKFDKEKMPSHMLIDGKGFDNPLTNVNIIPIENWVNLWQANISLLMKLAYDWEYTKRYRLFIPLIRALGSKDRVPLYVNKVGRNCNIHPSAIIEASIIGDNVHIGANAVVRLSIVGDGAYISDQALVRVCVIGENSYIANNNNIAFTVTYSDSFLISGPYQFSMFGKACAIMHCIDCDCRLDSSTIRAQVGEEEVVNTNCYYLGSCYGHRVKIGAGMISAPGSAIPNDLWISPTPNQVLRDFRSLEKRRNLFLSNGKLVTKEFL